MITKRQIRLSRLFQWREGIARYARFCASSNDHRERVENWKEGDDTYKKFLCLHHDDDRVSDTIIEVAMRIEAEVALHVPPNDILRGVESLTETLGQRVDKAAYQAILVNAGQRMNSAEQGFLERAKRTGAAAALHIPHLVEAHEVAQALNLTRLRKSVIWGKNLKIRATNDPKGNQGYSSSPFTSEQHREHRRLAKRFNRKPETVGDWRRKGPEEFAVKVAEMEARLLPADAVEFYRHGDEHPMATSMRVRRDEKKRQSNKERRYQEGVTAWVLDRALRQGVSESTIWRRRRAEKQAAAESEPVCPSVSPSDSEFVTMTVTSSNLYWGSSMVDDRLKLGSFGDHKQEQQKKIRKRTSPKRLTRKIREELKEWHHRTTGRRVTDAAIRQWRHRGVLDAKLHAMWGEVEDIPF